MAQCTIDPSYEHLLLGSHKLLCFIWVDFYFVFTNLHFCKLPIKQNFAVRGEANSMTGCSFSVAFYESKTSFNAESC